jgi:hypothetical protein
VSPWPIEEASLDQLHLDLRNVRIPGGEVDESAIANYLVESEDLLGLAHDVLRDGYLDNEIPVVTREDGSLVVLEGNRRVAALKAIHNQSLLGKSAPKMERLLNRYPDAGTPTIIRVMIAPSREAAQPLLARLHTRNPKKSWLREQQAVFYHAQLSPAVTVDALRARYPSELPSAIASFIRMGEMREVIRGLRYDDRELEQFVKTSKLKMTSLEYAYDLPKIQQALGLAFSKDGLLESKRISEGQRRGLMYLLGRFKDGTLNTRSPELKAKSKEHDPFAEQLRQLVAGEAEDAFDGGRHDGDTRSPEASPGQAGDPVPGTPAGASSASSGSSSSRSSGSGSAGTGGTAQAESNVAEGGAQAVSRAPNRGETRSRLNMDGFEYKGSSGGLRRRFEELQRLDVRDFPNATHDLLRTILECSIKDYFKATGQPLQANVMLGHCVTALARAFQGNRSMTNFINAINHRGMMHAHQLAGTATHLNASNHEPDSFVTGPDVHEAWERLKPILLEIVGQ